MSALPADRTIYLDALFNGFVQYVYAERPLYSYLNTHKGVKLVVTTGIAMKVNEHTTEYEKTILKNSINSATATKKYMQCWFCPMQGLIPTAHRIL